MASSSSCLMDSAFLVLFKKSVKNETLVLNLDFEKCVSDKWWLVAGKVMVERDE